MLGGLPYAVVRAAILTHPTMAEGLNVLLTSSFMTKAYQEARALARWEGEGGHVSSPVVSRKTPRNENETTP
jgi:hypothetical protein